MTDTVNVPREALERIAAADFDGAFSYEENPQYEGANTQGHIIRYRPNQPPPAPDGSRSVKMSFPVLAAAAWLSDAEEVLSVFSDLLTHAPALARAALAAAPKDEPVEADDFGDALLAFLFRHGLKVALDISEIESLRQSAIRAQPEAPKGDPVAIGYLEHAAIADLRNGFAGVTATVYGKPESGCEAIYTNHAPASDELLEAADFLAERVADHEHSLEADDFYGHVLPALARYRLAKHKGPQS